MTLIDLYDFLTSNFWIYIAAFIAVLSILVFVHEMGHYLVARWNKVRVETFSIGFGREIFGWTDRTGTRWKFSLVPLGGYVKLYGDVDPDTMTGPDKPVMTADDRKVAFFSKSVGARAAIVAAGPAINYVFAIILLTLVFATNGQPVTPPSASAIVVGSAAEKAGFQPQDRVILIDGVRINSFDEIRREVMIALYSEKKFTVERGGRLVDIVARAEKVEMKDRFGFRHETGRLGLISPRQAIALENITAIDGKPAGNETELRAALQKRMGETFSITTKAEGEEKPDSLIVSPLADYNRNFADPAHEDYKILYINSVDPRVVVHYGPVDAFNRAVAETWRVSVATLEALGQMITGTRSPTELGGVIRIGSVAGDMAMQGFVAIVIFTALLSINLGLVNLFPIPMLDGGHLVFYAAEAAMGRPVPDRIQEYAYRFGLVFLVCLMVYANLNDIVQLIL